MTKVIAKGQIGNALESTAADHILGVANDIFDENAQKYQQDINSEVEQHTNLGEDTYPSDITQVIDTEEFIQVTFDEEGRIIEGIRPDGTKYIAQLESPTIDKNIKELQEKIAENVFAIEMDDEGNLVAIIDEDSNVTDVGITDDGDIYADFNIE